MNGSGFVHDIDPVLGQVWGLYLWHYGLIYALGFFAIFLWLRATRTRNALTLRQVYDFSVLVALFVLIGGRCVAVFLYEWDYYADHPDQIVAYWIGGMASHGLLLGAITGIWLFSLIHRRPFLVCADMLVIPGALLMAFGRIANFVDGQIVGSVTDAWWGVKFPDAEGFRHPVVLYDAAKNLLIVPLLLLVQSRHPRPGVMTGHFMFWYGFLRLFVDLFRDYRVDLAGIPTGQVLNGCMAAAGLLLILWASLRRRAAPAASTEGTAGGVPTAGGLAWRRVMFALLLGFSLVMPSDRTQDVPKTYAKRHLGIEHSDLYPEVKIRD